MYTNGYIRISACCMPRSWLFVNYESNYKWLSCGLLLILKHFPLFWRCTATKVHTEWYMILNTFLVKDSPESNQSIGSACPHFYGQVQNDDRTSFCDTRFVAIPNFAFVPKDVLKDSCGYPLHLWVSGGKDSPDTMVLLEDRIRCYHNKIYRCNM